MAQDSRRRNIIIAVVIAIIALLLFLLTRCPKKTPEPIKPAPTTQTAPTPSPAQPSTPQPATAQPDEVLTPATLKLPERVTAGATFEVIWTGPANPGDYVLITTPDAPADARGNYSDIRKDQKLELTAPIEPGAYQVRYVTSRSRTILGTAPLTIEGAGATLDAAPEVVLGSAFPVRWTGPNNKGDYVTIVPKDAPDEHFASYVETDKGSPLTLTAPTTTGDAELRYVAAQGRKVLGRRPIKVVSTEVVLTAPDEAVAGSKIDVTWRGPNNVGDYITVVPIEMPDGQYANYANTSTGSPMKLLTPIIDGTAELRYMTGQGRQVLARRPIKIVAAQVTLAAAPECKPDSDVSITWTGPNNTGDYITIVTKATPDGRYAQYSNTTKGSPLTVKAPKEAGDAEIRYMTGQGNKVLARIPIKVVP